MNWYRSINISRRLSKSLIPYAVSVILLFIALEAAHGQCKGGDVLVGEDADNYYCMGRARYEGSAAQGFGSRFCRAKRAVATDQTAIRELGFATDNERFDLFANVAREQKAELQHKLFDALLDQGLEATETVLIRAKSLNPWNVNNAIDVLKTKGFGNETIIAALRRIALQRDKAAIVAAYRDFVEVVKAAKKEWNTVSEMAKDPEKSDLHLTVGALKIMQGNPEFGLAITAAELAESLVYLAYTTGKINELAKVSDDKVTRLAELTKRLRRDVDDANESKNAWRQSLAYTTAIPVCDK